jgi:hypothetical protein
MSHSLKRLLNDDDGEPYDSYQRFHVPPGPPPVLYSSQDTAYSVHSSFTSPTLTSPGSLLTPTADFSGDVPLMAGHEDGSLADLLGDLLSSNLTADAQIASINNIETIETSDYDLDASMEQWNGENLTQIVDLSSPSQTTPTPSLTHESNGSSSATTWTEDDEPSDKVCYGMVS